MIQNICKKMYKIDKLEFVIVTYLGTINLNLSGSIWAHTYKFDINKTFVYDFTCVTISVHLHMIFVWGGNMLRFVVGVEMFFRISKIVWQYILLAS